MMIRSIQQIGPIRPVMIEKTPMLNLESLPDFIFLMILLFVIYRISESMIRRTPGYTKEDKKIPIYQIICIIVVSSLQIGFGWSEELVKGLILLLISLYASVSDIQTHRVKDVASVMILITGFIGMTASEIPKHLFDGLLIGGILFICAVASNNRIGGADVKLSAACSFLLGFRRGMAGLVIGLLSAIICNLILNRKSKIKGKAFPLVPYLSVGFMVMYFF